MATVAPHPAINKILDFWFSLPVLDWFSDKHDDYITKNFGALVEKAINTDELDGWTETPSGSLALVLLLDQFTRNIYREGKHPNPGLSWAGDKKALSIASEAVAKGWDKAVQQEFAASEGFGYSHRNFFYLPFEHAENLECQIASCALAEAMQLEVENKRLQKLASGEQETEQDKACAMQATRTLQFALKHRDCIAAIGRFPKRNEPLGRQSTHAEKRWLEEKPEGF